MTTANFSHTFTAPGPFKVKVYLGNQYTFTAYQSFDTNIFIPGTHNLSKLKPYF